MKNPWDVVSGFKHDNDNGLKCHWGKVSQWTFQVGLNVTKDETWVDVTSRHRNTVHITGRWGKICTYDPSNYFFPLLYLWLILRKVSQSTVPERIHAVLLILILYLQVNLQSSYQFLIHLFIYYFFKVIQVNMESIQDLLKRALRIPRPKTKIFSKNGFSQRHCILFRKINS